jgi:hypothetical protein
VYSQNALINPTKSLGYILAPIVSQRQLYTGFYSGPFDCPVVPWMQVPLPIPRRERKEPGLRPGSLRSLLLLPYIFFPYPETVTVAMPAGVRSVVIGVFLPTSVSRCNGPKGGL